MVALRREASPLRTPLARDPLRTAQKQRAIKADYWQWNPMPFVARPVLPFACARGSPGALRGSVEGTPRAGGRPSRPPRIRTGNPIGGFVSLASNFCVRIMTEGQSLCHDACSLSAALVTVGWRGESVWYCRLVLL